MHSHRYKSSEQLVKIQFYDPVIGNENIWAAPLGNGEYRLENTPFFIYDISFHDIVSAVFDETNSALTYLSLLERSGNKTLRARSQNLLRDRAFRLNAIKNLEKMNVDVEEHRESLLSINIPPGANLEEVKNYLTQIGLSWEYGYPANLNE